MNKNKNLNAYIFITIAIGLSMKFLYTNYYSMVIPFIASMVFMILSIKTLAENKELFKENVFQVISQISITSILALLFFLGDICCVPLYKAPALFIVLLVLMFIDADLVLALYVLNLNNKKLFQKKQPKPRYDKSVPKDVASGEFEQKPNSVKKDNIENQSEENSSVNFNEPNQEDAKVDNQQYETASVAESIIIDESKFDDNF